jgi:hypothetical protein
MSFSSNSRRVFWLSIVVGLLLTMPCRAIYSLDIYDVVLILEDELARLTTNGTHTSIEQKRKQVLLRLEETFNIDATFQTDIEILRRINAASNHLFGLPGLEAAFVEAISRYRSGLLVQREYVQDEYRGIPPSTFVVSAGARIFASLDRAITNAASATDREDLLAKMNVAARALTVVKAKLAVLKARKPQPFLSITVNGQQRKIGLFAVGCDLIFADAPEGGGRTSSFSITALGRTDLFVNADGADGSGVYDCGASINQCVRCSEFYSGPATLVITFMGISDIGDYTAGAFSFVGGLDPELFPDRTETVTVTGTFLLPTKRIYF